MKHKDSLKIRQGRWYCPSNTCNSASDCKPRSPESLQEDPPQVIFLFSYRSRKETHVIDVPPQKPRHSPWSIKPQVGTLLMHSHPKECHWLNRYKMQTWNALWRPTVQLSPAPAPQKTLIQAIWPSLTIETRAAWSRSFVGNSFITITKENQMKSI